MNMMRLVAIVLPGYHNMLVLILHTMDCVAGGSGGGGGCGFGGGGGPEKTSKVN